MKRSFVFFIALAALVLAVPTLPSTAQSTYTVTDVGTLPGGTYSEGFGINVLGQVCGMSQGSTVSSARGFLYTSGLPLQETPAFTSTLQSFAGNVNQYGEVVGISQSRKGYFRGFLWRNNQLVDLTGLDNSYANAINDSGQIVGLLLRRAHKLLAHFSGRTIHGVICHPCPRMRRRQRLGSTTAD